MRKPRIGDVVEVLWEDSESVACGWSKRSDYAGHVATPQAYRTAGYWMGRSAGRVMIAASADPRGGTINHVMAIPVSCITETRVLGRAAKRTRKALS
jgi:hypothetical protein